MNNDYYKFLKELDGERKYTIDNSEKITKAVDNYLHENIGKEDKVFREYEEFLKEDEKREHEESWNFDNEEDEYEYDDEDEYIKKELLTISKLFEECMNTKYIKALKSKCDKKQKGIEEKIEKYKEEGKVHKDILIESQQYMSMYEIFYAIKEIVLSSFQGDFFIIEGKSVEDIIDLSIKSLERLDEEFNVMDKEFNATLIEFLSRLEEEYIQYNNYEENYERIYEIETYELLKKLLNNILSKEEGYKRKEKEKKKEEMSSEEMKIKEYSALLEKGYSYSKIAGEVGKSRQAVSNFCKKHNLSKKRKK